MIRAEHIVKSFDGRIVLDDISAEFSPGITNLIIGQSGSGKTVLLKSLVGLHAIDSGQIYYDDVCYTSLSFTERKAIRQQIGMIFQSFNLLEQRSVLRNVCFPLEISGTPKAEAKKRAEELLHGELSVALGIPFHEVPAYIESVIGKPGKRTKKAAHAAEASSAEEKE